MLFDIRLKLDVFTKIKKTLFLIFFLKSEYVFSAENIENKSRLANTLVSISEFKDVPQTYETIVVGQMSMKKKSPNCAVDKACVDYWTKIESDLLKDKEEQANSARKKLADLLTKRYSEVQLDWLVKNYNVPLLKNFRDFFNSIESSAPLVDASNLWKLRYKDLKPYVPQNKNLQTLDRTTLPKKNVTPQMPEAASKK